MMADVHAYAALAPDHLTGTVDAGATEAWVSNQLKSAGLDTGTDAYSYFRFLPQHVALTVDGAPVHSVVARFYSGTTPPAGITSELVDAGDGSTTEFGQVNASGHIAVIDAPTVDTALEPTLDSAVAAAKAAGAAALIAVTEGPEDYPVQEDIDSRAGLLGMPVVFIGKRSGAAVITAAKAGKSAKLILTADVGTGCDANVYGVLPGRDTRRDIVVGTPISAFTPAASEHGAGAAALIALARHYAALPLSQRPETLIFVAFSGHEDGFLGLPTLMQQHPDWFAHADAYIHLGASIAARLIVEDPSGTIRRPPLDDPSRLLYVSENPVLQAIAQRAFAGTGIGSAAPGVKDVGEQTYAYHAGIPIVAISGGSDYFHTAGDRPNGVDPAELAKVAAAYAGTIDAIASEPPGVIAAANALAVKLGAQQNPDATTAGGTGAAIPADEPTPVARCTTRLRVSKRGGDPSSTDMRPTGVHGPNSLVPGYDDPQPDLSWEGRYQSRTVIVRSDTTGAQLYATLYGPLKLTSSARRRPIVVVGPGEEATQALYAWSARDLASHGYVAMTIDPQDVGYANAFAPGGCGAPTGTDPQTVCPGAWGTVVTYADALRSGVDYMLSKHDPWRRWVNGARVGLAGHSLSSRAASWLQGVDPRIKAIVAWDNLTSLREGDAGTPSGGGTAGALIGGETPGTDVPVTPRVPALGEASDATGTTEPTNTDPDQKETAYNVWRSKGLPSMEVVVAGSGHLDWAQSVTSSAKQLAELPVFEYYTRAWFDRWLRGERSATSRLLARTVDGQSLSTLLSTKFRSGAFLDGHDCPDLRTACA
jgi:hypothetical protein